MLFTKKHPLFFIILVIGLLISLSFIFIDSNSLLNIIGRNTDLNIYMQKLTPSINSISRDNSNSVLIRVSVRDSYGLPQKWVKIYSEVINQDGHVTPESARTDEFGNIFIRYTPPDFEDSTNPKDHMVSIKASLSNNKSVTTEYKLTSVPVVLIHGYRATSVSFNNMQEYLLSKNQLCYAFDYDSTAGIEAGSEALSDYLLTLENKLATEGIKASKFNIVSHSLGGLITRKYTSSEKYPSYDNVKKVIFIAVPHHGSHMAELGKGLFNDKSIKDLEPNSIFFSKTFPSGTNQSLNPNIRVGNILGEYDEVVSSDSGTLDKWGIKSDIFNIDNNYVTVDNIIKGEVLTAQVHNGILNNSRVFEKVNEMLQSKLQRPSIRK